MGSINSVDVVGEFIRAHKAKNIFTGKEYGRKTTLDYVRMLYISYGSVCELETQILLAGDLDLIEKGELGTLQKDIAEIERMLKALIKSSENKPSNPWTLFSN
jgi:four helix bundle protein